MGRDPFQNKVYMNGLTGLVCAKKTRAPTNRRAMAKGISTYRLRSRMNPVKSRTILHVPTMRPQYMRL